jgi:leader peptidase (prepilin peptidase)/N-methyltransferase
VETIILCAALVPVVVSDLRARIIPDAIVVPAALAVVVVAIAAGRPWWGPPAAAALVGGVVLVPALARPEGMGMGDVKLAALMGAALGPAEGLAALLAGLLVAAAWGAAVARARAVRASGVALPLAPFLAAGVLMVVGPGAFLDSAHGAGPGDHPPAGAALRPPTVGGRDGRGHPQVAGGGAGPRAHEPGGPCARGGAPAARW